MSTEAPPPLPPALPSAPPPPDGASQPPGVPAEARTWGMLCHLSALSGLIGVGFGFVLGPLVCWLVKKDIYAFVDDQGKEALNFQITMLIATLLCIASCIGVPLAWVLGIADIVLTIVAALKANDGVAYRYPFSIKFIK